MIPNSEIPKGPEFEVKSKIGKIFKNIIPLKNILLGFMKLIFIFMNIMKKKNESIKMDVNTYHLELMFISISFYQQQKLMKKDILTRILFLRKKDKNHQKKHLVLNLLELIQIMQQMVMIYIVRLVTQKHLLMNSKIKKQKK